MNAFSSYAAGMPNSRQVRTMPGTTRDGTGCTDGSARSLRRQYVVSCIFCAADCAGTTTRSRMQRETAEFSGERLNSAGELRIQRGSNAAGLLPRTATNRLIRSPSPSSRTADDANEDQRSPPLLHLILVQSRCRPQPIQTAVGRLTNCIRPASTRRPPGSRCSR